MKDKKKVLFVAHVDSHIQAFHIPMLKLFKENGYIVDVASNGGIKFDYCDNKYNLPFERSPFSLLNIKAYRELKMILNDNVYDIIHCHTPVGGFISRLANKNCQHYSKTKIFYTAHGFHFYKGNNFIKNFIFKRIEKYGAKYTDVLITINKEDYEAAKTFKLKKEGTVEHVPGVGVDLKKINNITVDREKKCRELRLDPKLPIILSVGELNANKNHMCVIQALSKINYRYTYVICGKGSLEEELQTAAKKLGVNIKFLGYRSDILEILKISSVFLFPSIREGLPVSLMEAMACGTPCIASNIRGNKDILEGVGFLFENNIESCKEAIIKFLSLGQEEKNEISLKYKKRALYYDSKKVQMTMWQIYKREDR